MNNPNNLFKNEFFGPLKFDKTMKSIFSNGSIQRIRGKYMSLETKNIREKKNEIYDDLVKISYAFMIAFKDYFDIYFTQQKYGVFREFFSKIFTNRKDLEYYIKSFGLKYFSEDIFKKIVNKTKFEGYEELLETWERSESEALTKLGENFKNFFLNSKCTTPYYKLLQHKFFEDFEVEKITNFERFAGKRNFYMYKKRPENINQFSNLKDFDKKFK
jgi:hypothetical protein